MSQKRSPHLSLRRTPIRATLILFPLVAAGILLLADIAGSVTPFLGAVAVACAWMPKFLPKQIRERPILYSAGFMYAALLLVVLHYNIHAGFF